MNRTAIFLYVLIGLLIFRCQNSLTNYADATASAQTYPGTDGVNLIFSQNSAWSYLTTYNGTDSSGYNTLSGRQTMERDSTSNPTGVRTKINPSGSSLQTGTIGIAAIKNAHFNISGTSFYSKISIDFSWSWGTSAGSQVLSVFQTVFFDVNANGMPEQAMYLVQFNRISNSAVIYRIYQTEYSFQTTQSATTTTDSTSLAVGTLGTLTTHTASIIIEPTSATATKIALTIDGTAISTTNDAATNVGSNSQGPGVSVGSIIPVTINGTSKTLTQMIHASDKDSSVIRILMTNGDTNSGNISTTFSPILTNIKIARTDVGPF